jgi:hypothetical protein
MIYSVASSGLRLTEHHLGLSYDREGRIRAVANRCLPNHRAAPNMERHRLGEQDPDLPTPNEVRFRFNGGRRGIVRKVQDCAMGSHGIRKRHDHAAVDPVTGREVMLPSFEAAHHATFLCRDKLEIKVGIEARIDRV